MAMSLDALREVDSLKLQKKVLKTKATKSSNKLLKLIKDPVDFDALESEFLEFNEVHRTLKLVFSSLQLKSANDLDQLDAYIEEEHYVRKNYVIIKRKVFNSLQDHQRKFNESICSVFSVHPIKENLNLSTEDRPKTSTPLPPEPFLLNKSPQTNTEFFGFNTEEIYGTKAKHMNMQTLTNEFEQLTVKELDHRANDVISPTQLYMTPMGDFDFKPVKQNVNCSVIQQKSININPAVRQPTDNFLQQQRPLLTNQQFHVEKSNENWKNQNVPIPPKVWNYPIIQHPTPIRQERPTIHPQIHQAAQSVPGHHNSAFTAFRPQQEPVQMFQPVPQQSMIPPYTEYQRPKLPPLTFQPFDGTYDKWETFRDTYIAMIHSVEIMSNVEKFYRLKALLVGTATSFVNNVPVTDSNYNEVWAELCNYYDSPRRIAVSHIQAILNMKPANSSKPAEMRFVVDTFKSHIRALRSASLHKNAEILQLQILLSKMDSETRQKWESKTATMKELPSLQSLYDLIEKKIRARESVADIKNSPITVGKHVSREVKTDFKIKQVQYANTKSFDQSSSKPRCLVCNENHSIYRCTQYSQMSPEDRLNVVKSKNLCFNCLQAGHSVKDKKCQGKCRITECNRAHHTTLHDVLKTTVITPLVSNSIFFNSSDTLLATVTLIVNDADGHPHKVRALLDGGGQCNFISTKLCNKLKLKPYKESIIVSAISEISTSVNQAVTLTLLANDNKFSIDVSCALMERVTENLPQSKTDMSLYNLPTTVRLADPTFNIPGSIELLLSASVFFHSLTDGIINLGDGLPRLFNSKFGWLVAGGSINKTIKPKEVVCHTTILQKIHNQLEKFWNIENFPDNSKIRSLEDDLCEQHFLKNYKRLDGKFIVKLPFKNQDAILSDNNRHRAVACWSATERKFKNDVRLQPLYKDFMSTYLNLGHMKPVKPSEKIKYFIPHHHVFKKGAGEEKFRVVFNASSKVGNGISLNDLLMTGTTIQDDLTAIVLRFRIPLIPLVGDIEKMYRQVLMNEEDQLYQGIVWRESTDVPLQEYKLCTVTYGTKPAAFLATRCLKEIANLDSLKYPLASKVVEKDFYMDDLLTGGSDVTETIALRKEIQELLVSNGMPIRKWCTNSEEVLNSIPLELRAENADVHLASDEALKTLGMLWRPKSDEFHFEMTEFNEKFTKRTILSDISKLFDPLGLVGPVIFTAKCFMQQLWKEDLEWDQQLPINLHRKWLELKISMQSISEIHVQRCLMKSNNPAQLAYFGFADASEKGYGACIYLVVQHSNGKLEANLICSKSRVAPLKMQTIPKLELCAASLLAELCKSTEDILQLKNVKTYCFTDSKIVLSWLNKEASNWKVFVANRISKIHELTATKNWHHISTKRNPADLLSRGCDPESLKSNELWWKGPEEVIKIFMEEMTVEKELEISDEESKIITEEQKMVVHHTLTISFDFVNELYEKHSSLRKIIRIVAYVLKFVQFLKSHSTGSVLNSLTHENLNQAELMLARHAQETSFMTEVQTLRKGQKMPCNSKLLPLNPFLDQQSMLLRVGGRITHSSLPYNRKHPIILPQKCEFTRRLFIMHHEALLHAGTQLLLNHIRNTYWPINGKRLATHTVHSCVTCVRANPKVSTQLMGKIPATRLTPSKPFLNSCVDFAGPVKTMLHEGARCRVTKNSYICIFVCCSTRAVHLEAVSDLTTIAFIATLKRFIARRGKVLTMYCDNGTNFVGAKNEFTKILTNTKTSDELQHEFDFLTWHFIPASSPHMGGIYESNIKAMKSHLYKVIGANILNFEKFTTLLTQVEACMNSRPICVLPSSPEEILTLTPGHFLTGDSMMTVPEPDYSNQPFNRLNKWCAVQRMVQDFWKIWQKTYVDTLQTRYKWKFTCKNLQVDDVVLVKDENTKPMFWKLGRIVKVFPDEQGHVRVVELIINGHITRRTIHKLVKLPVNNE